ncbi:hypothetical protein BHMPCIPO_00037 [Ensifer sesbaniae]|nr:hypothetical protein [Ensifer sesbaniae]
MDAYEDAIRSTATKHAPWYVVLADNKWFSRLVIAAAIVDRLEELDPKFPDLDQDALRALEKAQKQLADENSNGRPGRGNQTEDRGSSRP